MYIFYWSSVKSLPDNYFLIHSDQFCLHFYNIRQCQLTISWVTIVTCGPIVFPTVLWVQHLQIRFDSNAFYMAQIFKSLLMEISVYKNEIAQYFHKWCFSIFCYQRENVEREGILWVNASEVTAMTCETAQYPQPGMGKITIKVL